MDNYQINNSKNFIRTFLSPVIEINSIITLHYFEYVKNFIGKEEFHDFWEMVYVDIGVLEVLAGDQRKVLKRGECAFHKPFERHNIFVGDYFASSFILTFDCNSPAIDFFKNKLFSTDKYEKYLISQIIKEGLILFEDPLNIMDQVKMEKKEESLFGIEQTIKNNIENLLISIIRNHQNMRIYDINKIIYDDYKINELSNKSEILTNILGYLKNNLYNNIDLNTMSKDIGLSISLIEKVVHAEIGRGVIQYFISLKIQESKRLLSYTDMKINEIADMLGFNSIHYFSRLFKKYTNMSPSYYKKSVFINAIL